MKKADVKIGQILAATSEEELKHPFQGKVEKIYENSAMVTIVEHDKADSVVVTDFHNRAVVRLSDMKKVAA